MRSKPDKPSWRHWVTDNVPLFVGRLGVAVAAAWLSFDALQLLAIRVGVPERSAWLVPVLIDAGALVGTILWRRERSTAAERETGKRLALTLIFVSMAGNAIEHAAQAVESARASWEVAVAIGLSLLPPPVLATVLHAGDPTRHAPGGQPQAEAGDGQSDLAVAPGDGDVEVAARVAITEFEPDPELAARLAADEEQRHLRPEDLEPDDLAVAEQMGMTPEQMAEALTFTGETWLYRLYNASGALLYVGVSGNPEERLKVHARRSPWWPEVADRHMISFPTRMAALAAEMQAIEKEQPRYNRMPGSLKDAASRRPRLVPPLPEEQPSDDELQKRAAEAMKANIDAGLGPIGRIKLSRELGISEYKARTLLEAMESAS